MILTSTLTSLQIHILNFFISQNLLVFIKLFMNHYINLVLCLILYSSFVLLQYHQLTTIHIAFNSSLSQIRQSSNSPNSNHKLWLYDNAYFHKAISLLNLIQLDFVFSSCDCNLSLKQILMEIITNYTSTNLVSDLSSTSPPLVHEPLIKCIRKRTVYMLVQKGRFFSYNALILHLLQQDSSISTKAKD